jgi:hemolysin-activating ACP:hemolysin acyltransferase
MIEGENVGPNNTSNKTLGGNASTGMAAEALDGQPAADVGAKAEQFWEAKLIAATFGNAVSLFLRSPAHRHYTVADFEWVLLPPLTLNQFMMAEATLDNGQTIPAGMVLFARVSKEVDARLLAEPLYPMRLHPNEWQSGDVFWIIDIIGGSEVVEGLLTELDKTVFHGKPFKMLSTGENGKLTVMEGRR